MYIATCKWKVHNVKIEIMSWKESAYGPKCRLLQERQDIMRKGIVGFFYFLSLREQTRVIITHFFDDILLENLF